MTRYALLLSALLLAGCGGEPEPQVEQRDHVWQDTIDTQQRARDVEGLLQDSAAAQRRAIEAQAR